MIYGVEHLNYSCFYRCIRTKTDVIKLFCNEVELITYFTMMNSILSQSSPDAISQALHVLKAGGVIAAPTETVYGLMTLWNNADGREKIYKLKHRPANKRLQMLAARIEDLSAYQLCMPPRLAAIAHAFWPGPLTVILPTKTGDTIGLRIPNHPFLLRLLQELQEPLAATSANLSGESAGLDATSAIEHLDGAPDLLIDGGKTTMTLGQASTVVSLCETSPVILREGPITLQMILDC